MFSPRTVFVLGAGASVDLNLPSGDDLRKDLMKVLERDSVHARFCNEQFNGAILQLCKNRGGHDWTMHFEEFADAAVRIRYALPMTVSIDNLLHTHRKDRVMIQVGKIAIATVILEKEASSYLTPKIPSKRDRIEVAVTNTATMAKTWYLPLMRLLATGRTVEEIGAIFQNVAFVVFNYDRCLEHFLVNAIINYFNVSSRVAAETVNQLNIIHPYGQVGYLGWQNHPPDGVVSSFGRSEGNLIEIAEQILTFTESANEGVIRETKNLITGAQTLVMMGFGFLPQNMELLRVDHRSEITRVFVTTLGIGDDDVEIVIAEIREMIQRRPTQETGGRMDRFQPFVERGTCRALMDHHWLRLTR